MKIYSVINLLKNRKLADIIKIIYFKILQNLRRKSIILFKSQPGISKNNKFYINSEYPSDYFITHFPEIVLRIRQDSEKYLNKSFIFLGRKFEYKGKINWHLDPEDNIEWQKKKYDERHISYIGSPRDPKIIWELNRHQYMLTLAKQFYLTKEEKYAESIVNDMLSWIKDNEFSIGINWASPLEIGIRLISWGFTLDLIEDSKTYFKYRKDIEKSICEQAYFLSKTLSIDRVIRTNHLLGELAGLFFISLLYKFKNSNKIQKKSLKLFLKEFDKQVYEDGVSMEQSTSYHRFVIDFAFLIYVSCQKYSIALPLQFNVKLQKMVEYISIITMPDSKVPVIGDGDDGRGIKLSESQDFWDMRGTLSTGIALFKNSELKKASSSFYEEAFWLLGKAAYGDFNMIKAENIQNYSKNFINSGHYVIRDDFEKNGNYIFFRAGIFGMGGEGHCSHSHDDILSPVICINGKQILTDSGTLVYNGSPTERMNFKISKAHNSIIWNKPIAIPKKGFGWEKIYDTNQQNNIQDKDIISFSFGIDKIPDYERTICFNFKNKEITILDDFRDKFEKLSWIFHIEPSLLAKIINDEIVFIQEEEIIAKLRTNLIKKVKIEEDIISKYYGIKIKNIILKFETNVLSGEKIYFTFF